MSLQLYNLILINMTNGVRTILSDRLVDGEKIDNLPSNTFEELGKKQNKLIAGENVSIDEFNPLKPIINVKMGNNVDYSILSNRPKLNGEELNGGQDINKESIGLGNIDNTSDINKPISSKQQEKLDELKLKTELLETNIAGLKEGITRKEHFRGYFASTEEINALTDLKVGDYAYNAQTGTKWIYSNDNEWENSTIIVPDKITPLSDNLPNIDGVANAGVSNEASRSDHTHPSDITKVDKVSGKGLSTNDFTDDNKAELEKIKDLDSKYVTINTFQDIHSIKNFVNKITIAGKNVVSSSSLIEISLVNALPANPVAGVLYLIRE